MLNLDDRSLRTLVRLKTDCRPKVFMCIGSPTHVWDSYGPIVGSRITKEIDNIICYGTMDNPVVAYNVVKIEEEVRALYPHHVLVAIDGAVTYKEEIAGKTYVSKGGINPGDAFDKKIKKIGDYNIKFAIHVDDVDNNDMDKPIKAADSAVKIIKKILEGV